VKAALALAEIRQRRDETLRLEKSVNVGELETLITAKAELGNDRPNENFFARALPRAE
jgi:hypothetical protein